MSDRITVPDFDECDVVASRELDITLTRYVDVDGKSYLTGNGILAATVGSIPPEDSLEDSVYVGMVLRLVERISDREWLLKLEHIGEGSTADAAVEELTRPL